MNPALYTSRAKNPRTMRVTILDPMANTTRTVSITGIQTTKTGLLATIIPDKMTAFRPYNSDQWMENVTSSVKFNIETDGMTEEESAIFLNERKFRAEFAKLSKAAGQ